MEVPPEVAYLETLWQNVEEAVDEMEEPLLARSQVMQNVQERPTYREMAAGNNAISTAVRNRPSAHKGPQQQQQALEATAATCGGGGGELGGGPDPLSHLQDLVRQVEGHQREYEQALLEAKKATELAHSMEQEVASLQQEADQLAARVGPPAPERARKVAGWLAERRAALDAQAGVREACQMGLLYAEARLRAAEAQIDFLADTREAAVQAQDAERRDAEATAAALRAREEKAARGYAKRLDAEAQRREDMVAAQDEAARKAIQAAEEGRTKGMGRLVKSQARIRQALAESQKLTAEELERRRGAVLGLKDSLVSVQAEVARQAQLYRAVQRQRRQLHDKEFSSLQEAGSNPYEVFRKREMQAEADRTKAAIRDNISERQLAIAAQLAREEEAHQRAVAARQAERAVREQYNKEMGVAAREARVEAYMQGHTVGGVAMLDPTGRLPVDPSSAVVAKTYKFGRGGAAAPVLAQQARRFPDEQPAALLLPSKYRRDADGAGAGNGGGGSDGDDDLLANGDMSFPTSPRAAAAAASLERYRQLAQRPPTKLEAALLGQAKARHKAAIGRPKAMMGREFGGDAFLASPAVVEFKDFDVGRTYTVKVQVINRSYKKNTFRVVGLPVEYGDVLDVSYALPGYLAPGVSSELTLTFTPKANADISTSLQLLADSGPFELPLRCLAKRAALSLSAASLDFGPGVTIGESASRSFELRNDGALDVEFRLDSPQLTDEERVMLKSTVNVVAAMTNSAVAAALGASTRGGGGGGADDDGAAAPPAVAPREERCLVCSGFSVFPCVGVVKGYSKVAITATFSPVLPLPANLHLGLNYKAPSHKRLSIPPQEVLLSGVGRDLPVFVEEPLVDLKCCMVGHVYRSFVKVRNNGKSAMKVVLAPRPELQGLFEFSPDFGFVQAGDTFPITVLFKPTSLAALGACREHLVGPEEDQVLEVPIRLNVPDQRLPVNFVIRAQLTSTDLLFDPPSLDFGDCVMSEQTGLRLLVTNPGRLPQAFGFVGLPPGLQVSPNDGYGYVLPGETIERVVSLQPAIPGPQTCTLTAKSLSGRTFALPCAANGVQPSLALSHNRVVMPATAVGDCSAVSVVLINRSQQAQAFEFGIPEASDLTFSPHVGEVPAGGRLRVQVDYRPRPPEEGEEAPEPLGGDQDQGGSGGGAGGAAAGAGRGASEGGDGGEAEDDEDDDDDEPEPGGFGGRVGGKSIRVRRSSGSSSAASGGPGPAGAAAAVSHHHRTAALGRVNEDEEEDGDNEDGDGAEGGADEGEAARQRHAGAASTSAAGAGGWYRWREHHITCYIRPPPAHAAAAEQAATAAPPLQLHLQLSTCAVLPDIVLASELPYVDSHQCYCLDYGPVPVGQRVVRTLQLANQGRQVAELSAAALDSREAFANVNALRAVAPGGTFRMLLAFKPQARTQYLEVLTVRSGRAKLRIALRGAGIAPELRVGPEGVTSSGLDLGDVLCGDSASKAITLTNICPFPLTFSMQTRGARDPNLFMRPVFHCRPAEGTLAQGESCEVAVLFTPSSQRPYFEDVLHVVVPNQQEQLAVPLRGRGWAEGVFVAGPAYPPSLDDPFLERQLAAASGAPLPPAVGGAGGAAERQLTLAFPSPVYCGEVGAASFEVGSLKSSVWGGAPGEATVLELPAAAREAGWAVSEAKLAVSAGEVKQVAVTYTAPAAAHAGMAAFYGHAEHVVATLTVVLRGGLPAPLSGGDGRRVALQLRCQLLPGQRPEGEPLPAGVALAGAPADAAAGGKKAAAAGAKK